MSASDVLTLDQVGLLTKDNFENIPFAYNLYKHNDSDHNGLAVHFKEAFCHPVGIEFLGVWFVSLRLR
jgi:hypothetical protein